MPLSEAATKLLSYLNIYKISPKEYATRISGEYPYPTKLWSDQAWFTNALNGYSGVGSNNAPRGLFVSALKELLAANL